MNIFEILYIIFQLLEIHKSFIFTAYIRNFNRSSDIIIFTIEIVLNYPMYFYLYDTDT